MTYVLSHTLLIAKDVAVAGETGVIGAVIEAMNTHINNVNVCRNGCFVLNRITFNGKIHKQ